MFKTENTRHQKISPYTLVILSFAFIIFIGAFLLTMPFCQQSGDWGHFIDSLFIATSGTCVTGYDCYKEGVINTLTLSGQIILCLMIQIGGLGFVTVVFFFVTLFRRKLSFRDRMFLSQAVNSTTIPEVSKFIRKLIISTFTIELIGFLLGLPVFFTLYENSGDAIWGSIFFSVSSFNNAGFDLFGNSSLILDYGLSVLNGMPQWAYIYMCIYSMVLVILGGISYLVIFEVFSFKKKPKQWRAFTKISLLMAGILIFIGTLALFLTDGLTQGGKFTFLDAFVYSVSSRTAGFATFDPYQLSVGGRIIICLLMFTGGAPLGTASGIKTTTLFVLIIAIISFFRGKRVHAFNRHYSQNTIIKALAVTLMSVIIVIIGYFSLCMFEKDNSICTGERAIFETISSFSTTGYTTELTVSLSIGGKLTSIVLMFLGRLGPITMVQVFTKNMNVEEKEPFEYVEEDILIG